jgi:regulator of replication initiation timing
MKNKYEIGQNYILNLENEQLRERIKELIAQFNEIKKKYENQFAERVVQDEGVHEIVQER